MLCSRRVGDVISVDVRARFGRQAGCRASPLLSLVGPLRNKKRTMDVRHKYGHSPKGIPEMNP